MAPAWRVPSVEPGYHAAEVNRGDRRLRRAAGKSDTIDAEAAARSVLAGQSTAVPKFGPSFEHHSTVIDKAHTT